MRLQLILPLLVSLCVARTFGGEQPKVFVAPTPAQPPPVRDTSQAFQVPVAPTPAPPPSAPPGFTAAELEKLAIPIALHPDPLISIILPASVYPLEIVQAARFVKDTNNLSKVDDQPWDENVKAVAKFPDLIAKMDADLGWTVKLGQAFLDQPKELMDTIQALRSKAQQAGTLRSTPQQVVTVTNVIVVQTNLTQVVTVTNQIVQVAPADPQIVYVPSYPPTVYYPPPAYVYDPVTPLVTFGFGMAMGAIMANNCDWHHGGVYYGGGGDVDIDIDRTVNRGDRTVNRGDRTAQQGNRTANAGARPTQQKWQPDQNRMRTSGAPSAATREARGWGGASTQRPGATPSTGMSGARSSAGNSNARPSTGMNSGNRSAASPNASQRDYSRPSSKSSYSRSPGSGGNAFGGMSSGSTTRRDSSRGSTSRSGGFGGSRGGSRGGRGGRGR